MVTKQHGGIVKDAIILSLVFGLLLGAAIRSAQAMTVQVMAYVFPPFLNGDLKSGLTPDLIAALNGVQNDYFFKLSVVSNKRRYLGFERQRLDVAFFEMPEWGWEESQAQYDVTRIVATGGERYVALKKPGRDQTYFNTIEEKNIGILFGYHYGFADYHAERDWLEAYYNVSIRHSYARLLDLTLQQRIDAVVMNEAYLKMLMRQKPELKEKLLISDIYDQKYQLPMLLNKQGILKKEKLESYLDLLKGEGKLQTIFAQYGLEDSLVY